MTMSDIKKTVFVSSVALIAALGLTACGEDEDAAPPADVQEESGTWTDDAADDAKDAYEDAEDEFDDALDEAKDKADEAGDEMEEGVDEMKDKMKDDMPE